jgi:hypothetical protein
LAVNLLFCLLQEAKVPTLDRRPGRPAFHHQGPPTAPQAYIADERTPKGPPSPLAAAAASGLDSQLMPPGLRDPVLRQGLVDMLSRRQGGVDAGNGGGGLLQSMLSLAAGGRRQGARMTAQQQLQQQQLLMEEAAAAMRPSDSLQAPGRRRFRGGPSAMKYQQVRMDLTCQDTLIKNKIKFSSYIMKLRMGQLQSHI